MIKATDLYIVQALNVMLQDIRKNTFLIRDILGDVVSDPLLSQIYGEKEVIKFEEFLKKDIQINVEYSLDMMRLPAIAVRVGGGVEDASRTGDFISDGHNTELVDSHQLGGALTERPRIILGPITPEEFNSSTGKIVFSDSVDLSRVYENMVIFDEHSKKEYPILLVAGNDLYIKPNSNPNLNNCTIRSKKEIRDKMINIRKYFFTNENVTLICMAVDPVEVIFLYQFLLYMIGRHRINLFETRNFKVATIQYSPIYRISDDPNIIFARDITIQGTVLHTYIETTSRPIEGLQKQIKIADLKTDPTYYNNIEKQGWDGEYDPPNKNK